MSIFYKAFLTLSIFLSFSTNCGAVKTQLATYSFAKAEREGQDPRCATSGRLCQSPEEQIAGDCHSQPAFAKNRWQVGFKDFSKGCDCFYGEASLDDDRYNPANNLAYHWYVNARLLTFRWPLEIPNSFQLSPHEKDYDVLWAKYQNQHLEIKEKYKTIYKRLKEERSLERGYYYPSDFDQLFECLQETYRFYYRWDCAYCTFFYNHGLFTRWYRFSWLERARSAQYDKYLKEIAADRDRKLALIEKERRIVLELFRQLYAECYCQDKNLRALYEHGFMQLKEGNNIAAMYLIKELIDCSLKNNATQYLTADTFVQLGIACSMSLEYAEAVEALTQALQKDPKNSDAYIERAIAYFELGNFDLAIKDYIASGKDVVPPQDASKIAFGGGFLKGAAIAAAKGIHEIIPSLWYSLRGMSQLLWTYNNAPITLSKDLIDATIGAIEYISTKDLNTIGKDMVPELHELITKWGTFDAKTRGEKSGFIFGKYGINIAASFGGTKAFKAFQELRRANAVCNLKALAASPYTNAPVMDAATKAVMVRRQQYFKSVKLHADKQGKHIESHRNYKELAANKENPSIWSHPEPEKVLAESAGTGMAVGNIEAGLAGYKEVITYKEYIGFYVDKQTGVKTPTKRFTIHYDGDGGAHMVPASPEKGFL